MGSLWLGIAAAVAASALYNLGVALQAIEARRAPVDEGLHPSLLMRLVRRPLWLAGIALGLVGWPLQTAALLLAPLTVVQPALGVGLVLLLPIGARVLGERIRRADAAAVAAVLLGVALLALVAPSRHDTAPRGHGAAIVLALVGAGAVLPYLIRDGRRFAALAAGAGFAWSGLTTKLVADAVHDARWLVAAAWTLATGLASGVAVLSESTALQRRPAHTVAPIVFATQMLIPVAAAPILAGERWSGSVLWWAGLAFGVGSVLAGVVLISRSRAVTGLTAAA